MKTITSATDQSKNFIIPSRDGGFFEARYVRRKPEYFICYLSSHSGCSRGCDHCWLTATKQTMMKPARGPEFDEQLDQVFMHYRSQEEAKIVHFNFMARGEPLDNNYIEGDFLAGLAQDAISEHGLCPKINISTIMPKNMVWNLADRFSAYYPTIYYSLYSMSQEFRNQWLPGAMDPSEALDELAEYQQISQKIIRIHGAFIKGENDTPGDIDAMIEAIKSRRIMAKMNIVRFNPPEGMEYEESDNLWNIEIQFNEAGIPCKTVPRVDRATFASCGQFITSQEYEDLD